MHSRKMRVPDNLLFFMHTWLRLNNIKLTHRANNDNFIKVEYKGIVPDAFQEDVEVIVEGTYDEVNKKFVANSLLAKCPSRYEDMDAKEHDKAMAEKNAEI